MSQLIVSLAAQHIPFERAYHFVHNLYGVELAQFAVVWNSVI
jgi:hypothetical protein